LIKEDRFLRLINNLDLGSPIAEDDDLLYNARVELSVFGQILRDEIDIVRGTKGSGKSALYKIFATVPAGRWPRHRGRARDRGELGAHDGGTGAVRADLDERLYAALRSEHWRPV